MQAVKMDPVKLTEQNQVDVQSWYSYSPIANLDLILASSHLPSQLPSLPATEPGAGSALKTIAGDIGEGARASGQSALDVLVKDVKFVQPLLWPEWPIFVNFLKQWIGDNGNYKL